VAWEHLGLSLGSLGARAVLGGIAVIASFIAIAAVVFLPLATYSINYVDQAGSTPTGVMMSVMGILVMTVNWMIGLLHIFVSAKVGFTRRDREGILIFKVVLGPCGGGTASQSLVVRSSDTPFMPAPTDSQHEWLWQSLGAGQYQVVSSLAPFDFDWKSLHPIYGTPLMAMLHHAILFPGGKEEEQRVHDMARYCMRQGADPRIVAPRATGLSVGLPPAPPGPNWLAYDDAGHCWWQYDGPLGIFWCEDSKKDDSDTYACPGAEPAIKITAEEHSGHCCITLALAIKRKLDCWGSYRKYSERIDRLMLVLTEADICHSAHLMLMNEGLVRDMAKAMQDTERADVELRLPEGGSVRAHSLILCNASPVLDAALQSSMCEGRTQVINALDISEPALKHLLSLIYTGCASREDLPMKMHLQALDLAHRWQVDRVVDALETKLVKQVSDDVPSLSLDQRIQLLNDVLESAVLKQLRRLHGACRLVVSRDPRLMEAVERGAFGRVAAKDLRNDEEPRKKRRRALEVS
ncbi:unnamed protein product, partial [Symbiodinium necroappetens]